MVPCHASSACTTIQKTATVAGMFTLTELPITLEPSNYLIALFRELSDGGVIYETRTLNVERAPSDATAPHVMEFKRIFARVSWRAG